MNDFELEVLALAGEGEAQVFVDAVVVAGSDHPHRDELIGRGSEHPSAHVVSDGLGGGQGAGSLAGGDDGGSTFLHGRDELALKEGLISDDSGSRDAVHRGEVDVRVLGARVVAPDDHILHLVHRRPCFARQEASSSVVVQAGEAAEVLLGDLRSIGRQDEAVGVGRVCDDEDLGYDGQLEGYRWACRLR